MDCGSSGYSVLQMYEGSSAHSPTFSSLHIRQNSFYNPSVALPTSQLILQPFCCFTHVTVHSATFLSLLLRHKLFTQANSPGRPPMLPMAMIATFYTIASEDRRRQTVALNKIQSHQWGQVAQAARRLAAGWTARVRSRVSEGCRFFFAPSCPDWPWGPLNLL